MKTDDLIAMLARGGAAVPPRAVARRFALGIGLGTLGSALMLATLLGVHRDWAVLVREPLFWFKFGFAMMLAFCGTLGTARLVRPGVALGRVPQAILAAVAVAWVLGIEYLLSAPPELRESLIFGATWRVCPILIALLAIPVFAGTLWAAAGLAPTRMRLTGAMAGFASGAVSAAVYAQHCPELAPSFIAIWYLAGVLLPTAMGALLGPNVLRW